jgi:mannosylglycerate hydrolase
MNKKYQGFVVSHTHWDRAWYLPFQTYRLRLVRLVDDLLDLLEGDPEYKSFMLDGQTVILEDYLALRPQNMERISLLVKSGRLSIGPWYTLPDLFLPCGESIVRNLRMGRSLARAFGEPMDVGYVPDPFGHFAQLPQLLQGFGISSFLFMRGADRSVEETGSIFNWRAPDGTTVLAFYMRDGYLPCGALGHPAVFGRFDGHEPVLAEANTRVTDALALLGPLQQERAVLLPNGCDHMPPQPELPQILQALNAEKSEYILQHGTLKQFIDAVRDENLEHKDFQGDLIGNHHHPILLSVYSTRMYLKQLNRQAENILLRIAEPLRACFSREFFCPESESFFDEAWRLLLRNHAHDNICGCSVDAVHRDDEVRFGEVMDIGRTLTTETLECLVKAGLQKAPTPDGLATDVFLYNPHPFSVTARVRLPILFPNPGGEWAEPTPERMLNAVSGRGHSLPITVEYSEARVARSAFLETTWGRRYHVALDVELPGMSYDVVRIFETASEPMASKHSCVKVIENTRFRLASENGYLTLTDKLHNLTFNEPIRFEYEMDGGDTYSFSPVTGDLGKLGNLIGVEWDAGKFETLLATYQLFVPRKYSPKLGASDDVELRIQVRFSLSLSESLEFEIAYENRASNGRLRALFPVGFNTDSLKVDGHFRVADRSVPVHCEPLKRPYPGEIPYDTFHQGEYAFAEKSNWRVWLANRGNPELSLVQRENQSWFALTLHRSVGSLSVYGGAVRQCQAGPEVPTPEAQCQRAFVHHAAWGCGQMSVGEVRRSALAFACAPWGQEMPYLPHVKNSGNIPRAKSFLTITNDHVALDSCRAWFNEGVVCRMHNLTGEPQNVELALGFPATTYSMSDLNEHWNTDTARSIEDGTLRLSLRPYEIGTVITK